MMDEVGIAAKVRLNEVVWAMGQLQKDGLVRAMGQLQKDGLALVRTLWPNTVEPASVSLLSRWLEAGSGRVSPWHASAARAGAFMALRVAKSWYSDLNLVLLAFQRVGTDAELEAVAEELAVQASDLALFVSWDEFIPERAADDAVIPEDQYLLALDDP
ncbi:hypothetical protein ZWY2020_028962 [Hordeum vulgare]|nr:hypothetical protein ZWY2020_028962 [Hordeum vulgare]